MREYKENGKVYEITLETGRVVKVMKDWAVKTMSSLDTDLEDVLLMFLEDNGYLVNDDQEELDNQAKGVVKNIAKAETPKKKTQRERVAKDNPDKEYIIGCIAEYLEELQATNVNITNKTKLIEFTYKSKEFKLDLVEKRKKKAE